MGVQLASCDLDILLKQEHPKFFVINGLRVLMGGSLQF